MVDELDLDIVPVPLGEGIPLWLGVFRQRARHVLESNTSSKGLIALKETPKAPSSPPATRSETPDSRMRCWSSSIG